MATAKTLGVVAMKTQYRRSLFLVAIAVFFLFLSSCLVYLLLRRPFALRVIACAVGQGDGLLFSYGHQHILLDSGRNSAIMRCLQRNISFLDPVIEMVILTHGDADHIGGFESVTAHYHVEQLLTNPLEKKSDVAEFVRLYAQEHPQTIFAEMPGSSILAPGWRGRLVWSEAYRSAYWNEASIPSDENGGSVSFTFQLQSFGFLSLGDLECSAELAVASLPLLNKTDFLKISHHGSKFSSCLDFLAKVRPEIGIISVGKGNSYGHPGENVLENLENEGITAYRTDYEGDLIWWLGPNKQLKREICAQNDHRCRND